jgi:hypothetical protein
MKAKKALKRLNKIEALLTNVIDQFPRSKELLESAKDAVVRARKTVLSHLSNKAGKRSPVKAETAKQGHLTAEGRKRLSLAAKRRWAVAKGKGVHAVTGRPLSKKA